MKITHNVAFIAVISVFLLSIVYYEPYFINIGASSAINTSEGIFSSSGTISYLIITSSDFVSSLEPLKAWKTQRGLPSYIITTETISGSYSGVDLAAKIKSCIISFYNNNDTQWVLLAGDVNIVPTRYVYYQTSGDYVYSENLGVDYYYADLNNNWDANNDNVWNDAITNSAFDWVAEVYVGRLPADTTDEMTTFVNRIIKYEKNPEVGDWMTKALFASAFANYNEDNNHNNVFDPPTSNPTSGSSDWPAFDANHWSNWVLNRYLPSSWTPYRLAEVAGLAPTTYTYEQALTEANVVTAINSGVGTAMLSAHGSPTSISRLIFTNDKDNDSLYDAGTDSQSWGAFINTGSAVDSSDKMGLFYINACLAGTFDHTSDCLSEYLLQTAAIGCIAAFLVSWYEDGWYEDRGISGNTTDDHGGWYNEGLAARFWEQFFNKSVNHPAKALALARADFKADRAIFGQDEWYPQDSWNTRVLAQFNLLGDPEVPIWTKVPSSLVANVTELSSNTFKIKVLSNNESTSNIVVTLASDGYFLKGMTDVNGELIVSMSLDDLPRVYLTASSATGEYLPFQILIGASQSSSTTPTTTPFTPMLLVAFVVILYYKRFSLK